MLQKRCSLTTHSRAKDDGTPLHWGTHMRTHTHTHTFITSLNYVQTKIKVGIKIEEYGVYVLKARAPGSPPGAWVSPRGGSVRLKNDNIDTSRQHVHQRMLNSPS